MQILKLNHSEKIYIEIGDFNHLLLILDIFLQQSSHKKGMKSMINKGRHSHQH